MVLGAENLSRIKLFAEVRDLLAITSGRGAFYLQRSRTVRFGGANRSENAGMSSENSVRNRIAENPRFSTQCKSA